MQHGFEARQRRFRDGGQARKRIGAFRAGDRERAHLALADQRHRRRQRREIDRDVAADQIGERRRAAAIGHVRELDAAHHLEQHGAEMDAAADAGGGVVELARILLGERDQLRDAACRQIRVDQHDQRAGADQADRREVLARIVADVLVERRVDRQRAGPADDQGVAVGRGLGDRPRRGRAAGAGAVLDHDLLAERLAHLLGRDAREQIVAAAGRVRHDQGDRTVGVVLRVGGDVRCKECEPHIGEGRRNTPQPSSPRKRGPTTIKLSVS